MTTLEQLGAVRAELVPWSELPVLGHVWASDPRTIKPLVDKNGRPRSRATLPGFRKGEKPGNYGKRFDPTVLSVGEVRMLIVGRSRTSASGIRDRFLMAFAYATGLRISEILDLQPDDIRFENGTWRVLVRCGKGGKRRIVGMSPDAAPYFEEWMKCRERLGIDKHCRLFCTIAKPNVGGPLGSPQVRTMLKRVAVNSGLDKRITPHQFRHSLAVDMARRGIPLPVISRQLGHSNVATTSIYLRGLSDDEMFDAMAELRWLDEDES
jgi:site-specific recombinase XerD